MSALLLKTKLCIPPTSAEFVPRKHLVQRLNESLGCKLILICAPAGYGKTTLLSEWVACLNDKRGRKKCVVWLSLDKQENNLYRFWNYFIAALNTISHTDFSSWLSWTAPPSVDDLTALIDKISKAIPNDFIFVLDDYHFIKTAEIHEALNFLIDYLPHNMHLVISSREEPPLCLAQLRVRDQLVEIRANELSFSPNEAFTFFNQCMGLELSTEFVAQIQKKAEGWIAGMKLAGLAFQSSLSKKDRIDLQKFIHSFSGAHHYVVNYLAEQVLRQQTIEVQDFLLETSILDRLTSTLCNAVTGQSNSRAMLERLAQANLFLFPLEDERHWYRYHQLFADFLSERLQQFGSAKTDELHLRAANWFKDHGLLEEAVYHALQAKNYQLAIRLIEQVGIRLLERSEYLTMARWMKLFPAEFIQAQPQYCLKYATALMGCGFMNDAKPLLQVVEQKLLEENVSEPEKISSEEKFTNKDRAFTYEGEWQFNSYQGQLAWLYFLQASAARFHNPTEAIKYALRALELIPGEYFNLRGVALLFLGHAYLLDGEIENAEHILAECCVCSKVSDNATMYLSAVNYLGQIHLMYARLRQAMAIFLEAYRYVEERLEPHYAGIELILQGNLFYEWNDVEKATQLIHDGLHAAEAGGDFVFLIEGYIANARLELALGDSVAAQAFIHKAERIARPNGLYPLLERIESVQIRIWLAEENLKATELWVLKSGLNPDNEICFQNELPMLTLARVMIAQKNFEDARRLLERMLQGAKAAGRMGRVIEILVLLSLTYQASGDITQACTKLCQAITLASPEGYVRTFLDEGESMKRLLMQINNSPSVKKYNDSLGYIDNLLSAIRNPHGEKQNRGPTIKEDATLLEHLSIRELQVLRLIADGMSYEEVAQELVVALSTVQWHIKNIYQKLNAHSGIEAVAIARRLSLLS